MKKGDRLPVAIQGIAVGFAEIESVADGRVTFYIPAQRAQVGLRTELEDTTPAPDTSGTETIIDGVDRASTTVVGADNVETLSAEHITTAQPDAVSNGNATTSVEPVPSPVAVDDANAQNVQQVADSPSAPESTATTTE